MTIRVFGKESLFQKSFYEATNKFILCEVTRTFCDNWYHTRMYFVTLLFSGYGTFLIISMKGILDPVTLLLIHQYTYEVGWVESFLGSYMSTNRTMLSA